MVLPEEGLIVGFFNCSVNDCKPYCFGVLVACCEESLKFFGHGDGLGDFEALGTLLEVLGGIDGHVCEEIVEGAHGKAKVVGCVSFVWTKGILIFIEAEEGKGVVDAFMYSGHDLEHGLEPLVLVDACIRFFKLEARLYSLYDL